MALTAPDKLRSLLGEDTPAGTDASETLFSDEEIQDFLDDNGGDPERAAYDGWRVKAARLSSLVDTTEGNSQRKFSQLLDNANDMVKMVQAAIVIADASAQRLRVMSQLAVAGGLGTPDVLEGRHDPPSCVLHATGASAQRQGRPVQRHGRSSRDRPRKRQDDGILGPSTPGLREANT